MRGVTLLVVVLCVVACGALSASAQLQGTDVGPGDSCAGLPAGATAISADADQNGAEVVLICNGTTWQTQGVKVPYDSATCDQTKNGTIRYISGGDPPWEFCDGSAWANFKQPRCQDDDTGECYLQATRSNDDPDFTAAHIASGVNILGVTGTLSGGGGCTAPASCTNVGDVCSDGSLFAGFMVYNGSCEPLYVTDDNQSTSSLWKTATGTNDITDPADKNDAVDGQYNRDNRGGGTFPAFELCENNTYHGKNDWYLPARAELNLLWLNQAAIDANAAGNFTTSNYWSSTEYNTNYAWYQLFGGGNQNGINKTFAYAVRCVRRD